MCFQWIFSKVLKIQHFRSWEVYLSRQQLSNEHTMSSVRQFWSFDPNGGWSLAFWGPGTKSRSSAAILGQRVSGMAGHLIFAFQLARPKERFWGHPGGSGADLTSAGGVVMSPAPARAWPQEGYSTTFRHVFPKMYTIVSRFSFKFGSWGCHGAWFQLTISTRLISSDSLANSGRMYLQVLLEAKLGYLFNNKS